MRHIPHSSRVFIGIVVITFLLTYVSLALSQRVTNFTLQNSPSPTKAHESEMTENTPVDISDWATYEDKSFPITFPHPKDWTISSTLQPDGFYNIILNPGTESTDMHIFVSDKNYYAIDGLRKYPATIGHEKGFMISNNLGGVKAGEYYYTFDGSLNSTESDEFAEIMNRVKFQ
jgi:hypothetical protein